jgi:hypothetical protein
MMRRFQLDRSHDVSGVSGTGIVADGVAFPDGSCVVRWRGDTPSTVIWPDLENVLQVHGHNGATRIRWIDLPEVKRTYAKGGYLPRGYIGGFSPRGSFAYGYATGGLITPPPDERSRIGRWRDCLRSWLEDIHAQRVQKYQRKGAVTTKRKDQP